MVLVKICGITNLDDALAAVDAGADALGFNFCRRSPRYITPPAARSIVDELRGASSRNLANVLMVGVFVNEELAAIEEIAATAALSALQLHGNESPEYCKALPGRYLIKAFAARDEFAPETVLGYDVAAIMLDAFDERVAGGVAGGSGKLGNWAIARATREIFPKLFLAGGLSAKNVGQAIATVNPYAVDACSRLESSAGRKDHARVRDFIAAVRAASG
jgi:phosphoribosylanthranilate isomerase